MKPMPDLDSLLEEAKAKNVFGTKMRSVIKENNVVGIKKIIDQQFELADQIIKNGLVPIVEPEVDINSINKKEIEHTLRDCLKNKLDSLPEGFRVLLKLTLPEEDDFYAQLVSHPNVIRVIALSGGYGRSVANEKLMKNHGVIASFNRALSEGLFVDQTDDEFDQVLEASIKETFVASNHKDQ
jgi:fructose-bisphosphate aldolase class I